MDKPFDKKKESKASRMISKLSIIAVILLAALCSAATVTITATAQFTFSPKAATAQIGDTITFIGLGTLHNVAQTKSATSAVALSGGFASGAVGDKSTYSFTITQDMVNAHGNTLFYMCEPHAFDGMRGSIVVSAATPTTTDASEETSAAPSTTTGSGIVTTTTARPSTVAPTRSGAVAVAVSVASILVALVAFL